MIFTAFAKAISQFGDPRFRRVIRNGICLSALLLLGGSVLLKLLVAWLIGPSLTLPVIGEVTWVSSFLSNGVLVMMLAASTFMMIPVASAMASLFSDQVADAVEDVHYPHLPSVKGLSIWDSLKDGISALGVMIAANTLALILYLLLPPFAPFIFWALNGFLLGREYFTLVAARRVGLATAKHLRRRHRFTIWAAGILMALPLSVPILNLIVPVLGAATFTHIYHRLKE